MHTITPTTILDCGHVPTNTDSPMFPGYALHADDSTLCYACADAESRAELATADRVYQYLSTDGKSITTWTGGTLARVTEHGTARTGWYDSTLHYIRAVAPDGSEWYGKNGGPGMCITLRRAKGKR